MTMLQSNNERIEDASAKAQGQPWLHFLYLAICFFLAGHHPDVSTWDVNPAAKVYASTAGSGSVQRQVSFLLLVVYGLVGLAKWKNWKFRSQGAVGSVAFLLISWTFLSYAWSQSPDPSRARLIGVLVLILVAIAVCLQFRPQDIVLWIGVMTLCYCFIGVTCEIALRTFHPWTADYRFSGTLSPNEQGANCALAAMASYYLWRSGTRKTFWAVGMLAAFAFLLMTKSRTASISLLIALPMFQVLVISNWRKRFLVWTATGVLITLVAWLQWNGAVSFGSLLDMGRDTTIADADSLTGRLPLWTEVISKQAPHPTLGYGFGAFWTADRIADVSRDQHWGISAAHSAYLDMLVALGSIGASLYVGTLLFAIRRARVGYSRTAGDQTLAFFGTLQMFCLIDGIADSAPVEVSAFLCFCLILSTIYLGFICSFGKAISIERELPRKLAVI